MFLADRLGREWEDFSLCFMYSPMLIEAGVLHTSFFLLFCIFVVTCSCYNGEILSSNIWPRLQRRITSDLYDQKPALMHALFH